LNPGLVSGLGLDTEKAVIDGDETGLDGLPHAHFVCEQDRRHDPPRHLRSDADTNLLSKDNEVARRIT